MGYLELLLYIVLAIIICSVIIYIIERKINKKSLSVIFHRITICIFVGNITFIIFGSLIMRTIIRGGNINYIPFSSYLEAVKSKNFYTFELLLFNIITFIPLGIMLPIIKKLKAITIIFAGLCFSLFIEISQLLSQKGIFDIDDVINNTLGVIIGYCIYKCITGCYKLIQKR